MGGRRGWNCQEGCRPNRNFMDEVKQGMEFVGVRQVDADSVVEN